MDKKNLNMENCRLEKLKVEYEDLITRKNKTQDKNNGIYVRYKNPVLTAEHAPLIGNTILMRIEIHICKSA